MLLSVLNKALVQRPQHTNFSAFSINLLTGVLFFSPHYLNQTLTSCRAEVCKALGMSEDQFELSMGMSGDFEQAVI